MKRIIFALLFIALSAGSVYASAEKGNPAGTYAWDQLVAADGTVIPLAENKPLLFINGTLAADADFIIRNGRTLVPLELIGRQFDAETDGDEFGFIRIKKAKAAVSLIAKKSYAFVNGTELPIDCPAELNNGVYYVPLRFVAEALGYTVNYTLPMSEPYTYYYDTSMPVSPPDTIIRDFPNIIIDEKSSSETAVTQTEAETIVKTVCLAGLSNFKTSLAQNLTASGEASDRFDNDILRIETEINRVRYIGEVSRYHKFTIGPYDILFDKYSRRVFFVIYASGTVVKEVDVEDDGLFMPVFIVG